MASQSDELQVSGSVHGNFTCSWTIKRFSSLDSQVGKCHTSGLFQLEEKNMECYLGVYPGGTTELSKGYVSCFIFRRNKLPEVKWKSNLTLRNSQGINLFDGIGNKWEDFTDFGCGYHKTIKTKDLARLLYKDVLVVTVEATYCAHIVKHSSGTCGRRGEISPTVSIIENLGHVWRSKENTDCVISVEGEDIPAHSFILGTHSKVFAAMFKHDTIEKDSRCVKITDFGIAAMTAFIEFLYSGDVHKMNFDLALELLRASDKYEVSHLKSHCSNYLMSLMNCENACQILVSADIYNAEVLRGIAIEYIYEELSHDDLAAQRSTFMEKPELFWDVFEHFSKKRKREDDDND